MNQWHQGTGNRFNCISQAPLQTCRRSCLWKAPRPLGMRLTGWGACPVNDSCIYLKGAFSNNYLHLKGWGQVGLQGPQEHLPSVGGAGIRTFTAGQEATQCQALRQPPGQMNGIWQSQSHSLVVKCVHTHTCMYVCIMCMCTIYVYILYICAYMCV